MGHVNNNGADQTALLLRLIHTFCGCLCFHLTAFLFSGKFEGAIQRQNNSQRAATRDWITEKFSKERVSALVISMLEMFLWNQEHST